MYMSNLSDMLVVTLDWKNPFNMAWPQSIDIRMYLNGLSVNLSKVAWNFLNDRVVRSGRVRKGLEKWFPSLRILSMRNGYMNKIWKGMEGLSGQVFADYQIILVGGRIIRSKPTSNEKIAYQLHMLLLTNLSNHKFLSTILLGIASFCQTLALSSSRQNFCENLCT